MFDYTHAVVRGMPDSFLNALVMHPPTVPMDLERAKAQKVAYVDLLRSLVPTVVEVAADE
jgi:hypothetical protein